jgi:hypothetical protein
MNIVKQFPGIVVAIGDFPFAYQRTENIIDDD